MARLDAAAVTVGFLAILAGCNSPPPPVSGAVPVRTDPFAIMVQGDELAKRGRYADALNDYLWVFDHGVEAERAFNGARASTLLEALLRLSSHYPEAKRQLEQKCNSIAREITQAVDLRS